MEKIIRDVIEKNRNTKLLDTDTFDFRCTCCGACCTNREDIVMSGYDVMRIQNHLGIDFTELLEKYCELYVGRPSGIPLLRIKPKGAKKICPFLFRSKCKIHEVKPTVCALFPVGRATAFDKESGKPERMSVTICRNGYGDAYLNTMKNAVCYGTRCSAPY